MTTESTGSSFDDKTAKNLKNLEESGLFTSSVFSAQNLALLKENIAKQKVKKSSSAE